MTDDASDLLRGAAFHEAGHAIVAAHFRLPLGKITIDVDGGGNAEIDDTADLPIIGPYRHVLLALKRNWLKWLRLSA